MKPMALILCGQPADAVRSRYGGYEDHFAAALRVEPRALVVVPAFQGAALPDSALFSGVLLSGSGAAVDLRVPWEAALAAWALEVVRAGPPLLAVCFSHQLLALAFGGRVDSTPAGPEFGSVPIGLTAPPDDPLFGRLPRRLSVQEAHYHSVLVPPAGFVSLAASPSDSNHAFRFGERAWSVQFHPERDAELSRATMLNNRDALDRLGFDVAHALANLRSCSDGARLLQRFGALCRGDDSPRT